MISVDIQTCINREG